jgi:hypothetical protein
MTFDPGSPPLPPIQPGISLLGRCGPGGPQVIIDGSGVSGPGLDLRGNNQLSGIWVRKFEGIQISTTGQANRSSQSCVRATRT